jgi:glutathione S-transferase
MAHEIILHHYDTSPFSEKPRVMFGVKELAWRAVTQPVIMPKPELTPLTGGYRRIPVMQVGADVYCDSQVILAEIEARHPDPPAIHGGDWAVNLWADRLFFQTTVAVVFGEMGDEVPEDFKKDREKLSGRPFDVAAMKAAAGPMRGQWQAHAAFIERGLIEGDFLGGSRPSLADIASYMNIWWLRRAARGASEALLSGLPRTEAWRARIKDIGHGARTEMTGAEALAVAKAANPAKAPAHDPAAAAGLAPGAAVSVRADDYGRDPIEGALVAATAERVVIAREDPAVGQVHLHFPRAGYLLSAA